MARQRTPRVRSGFHGWHSWRGVAALGVPRVVRTFTAAESALSAAANPRHAVCILSPQRGVIASSIFRRSARRGLCPVTRIDPENKSLTCACAELNFSPRPGATASGKSVIVIRRDRVGSAPDAIPNALATGPADSPKICCEQRRDRSLFCVCRMFHKRLSVGLRRAVSVHQLGFASSWYLGFTPPGLSGPGGSGLACWFAVRFQPEIFGPRLPARASVHPQPTPQAGAVQARDRWG